MTDKRVLITGVSGFIAGHTALEFLKAGYHVRGSVRNAAKGDAIAAVLGQHGDISRLEFVEADLGSDEGWAEAVKGCDCVAHLASPFPLAQPKDENDLIRPAVEGTLRVLKAAKAAGVKRFVQTSSMVAVIQGHRHEKTSFTEDDWSNLAAPGITAYQKSKTLAEKAGRQFMAEHGSDMHYATVNPGLVWGPALDRDIGSSVEIVRMFLAGKYPGAPKLKLLVVDVRDIAKMHRLAMETGEPSGGRYLGVCGDVWMMDMARMMREELGAKANKAPKFLLPNFVIKAIGLVDAAARTAIPDLDLDWKVDNSRTRQALGIEFISPREALLASARSLIDHGIV
ncbi:MAG: aldehyde reductase [Nitratireductor sp.]|nr:aldehyde reductase [Nitratireductor sp.]